MFCFVVALTFDCRNGFCAVVNKSIGIAANKYRCQKGGYTMEFTLWKYQLSVIRPSYRSQHIQKSNEKVKHTQTPRKLQTGKFHNVFFFLSQFRLHFIPIQSYFIHLFAVTFTALANIKHLQANQFTVHANCFLIFFSLFLLGVQDSFCIINGGFKVSKVFQYSFALGFNCINPTKW